MRTCPRVVGASGDGKRLVTCGKPVPCEDHYPHPKRTEDQGARFWPAGAHPARYLRVVDLPQISDDDWQEMARGRLACICPDGILDLECPVCVVVR